MIYIRANNIRFRYENQVENILEDINFIITNKSKIGLIGNNGCGKTTIINLIKNTISPVSGNLYIKDSLNLGILSQEMQYEPYQNVSQYLWSYDSKLMRLKNKMANLDSFSNEEVLQILESFESANGYQFENKILTLVQKFGFSSEFLKIKIKNLSGGEKTKVALFRILLQEPELLLLDEPTNHLDLESLEWLENFLKNSGLPYLVVSHDRKFLDNCASEIWEVYQKELRKYSGNYSFYKKEKDDELQLKIHKYQSQKKKIRKLKKAMSDRRGWALGHQGQTGSEGYAPIYESLVNFSKTAMKKAKNLETRINKELEKAESQKPFIEKVRKIHIDNADIRTKFVLKVKNLSKKFSKKIVLNNLSFNLNFGDKIAVVGKNGSGKSTLLKILTGEIKNYSGDFSWTPQADIGYYSQEFENINPEKTIIDEVTDSDYELQTTARTILGCFNIRKDEVFKKIKDLSIGERSKVAIAKIILSKKNVLILDEPTNHLEISAREALENALKKFNGTVVFVSHDRYFQRKIASGFLNIETGKIR